MTDPIHTLMLTGSGLTLALATVADAADVASRPEQLAVLAFGAVVLTGLYMVACMIWPFANCGRCDGAGKSRSPSGKKFRNCPRCKGTGRRKRLGRRLLDHNNHRADR